MCPFSSFPLHFSSFAAPRALPTLVIQRQGASCGSLRSYGIDRIMFRKDTEITYNIPNKWYSSS